MKNKIVGILVCMLLIATAVPAVTSVKNNAINTSVPSHPLTGMGGIWTQEAKLLASDGAANDQFGIYAALSGDTVLVGSYLDDDNGKDSGSAYVFVRSGTTWNQQAKLLPSDGAANDYFGCSVALDGDTALVGAQQYYSNGTGYACVFIRSGATWTQQAKLTASDGAAGDNFGVYASLDGDSAIITASHDQDMGTNTGSAYVFTRTGTTWTQQAKLLASDAAAGDRFGVSASLKGDNVIIGSWNDDDNGVDSGSAYVFTRTGSAWTQQAKLLPQDGAVGDWFGSCVSLSGDTALIAASEDDDNGQNSGSAYVFTRTGTTWTQQVKLLPSDGAAGDEFSIFSTWLDGNTAVIGAPGDDDKGSGSGSSYVFTRSGTTWTQQQKLLALDGAAGDQCTATALEGNTAIVTAWYDDDMGINSGSAYVFTKVGLTFSITGGLGVTLKITNNGTTNLTGVPWQIHVKGGMLGRINKTVNGTIDIPAGKSVTVKTGILLGFGALSIVAKVADEEQTATGTQILIFSMIKK